MVMRLPHSRDQRRPLFRQLLLFVDKANEGNYGDKKEHQNRGTDRQIYSRRKGAEK